jgi:hypothetical protein
MWCGTLSRKPFTSNHDSFPSTFPLTWRDGIVSTSTCLDLYPFSLLSLSSLIARHQYPDAITVSGPTESRLCLFLVLSRIPLPHRLVLSTSWIPISLRPSRPQRRHTARNPDTKPLAYDLLPTYPHLRRRRRHHRDLPTRAHNQASRRRTVSYTSPARSSKSRCSLFNPQTFHLCGCDLTRLLFFFFFFSTKPPHATTTLEPGRSPLPRHHPPSNPSSPPFNTPSSVRHYPFSSSLTRPPPPTSLALAWTNTLLLSTIQPHPSHPTYPPYAPMPPNELHPVNAVLVPPVPSRQLDVFASRRVFVLLTLIASAFSFVTFVRTCYRSSSLARARTLLSYFVNA